MSIYIDQTKCTVCTACLAACPNAVLYLKDGKVCSGEGCQNCGSCKEVCDVKAIFLDDGSGGAY